MPDKRVTLPHGWKFVDPRATSFEVLLTQLHDISTRQGWIHRGEPRWFESGKASLGRYLSTTAPTPLEAECQMIEMFRQRSHAFLDASERAIVDTMLGLLVLMQHHKTPTRLLDWTHSLYVAAYHAAALDRDEDGVVWSFNPGALVKASPPEWRTCASPALDASTTSEYLARLKSCPELLVSVGIVQSTGRMLAQQGTYTFGHPATMDHRIVLGDKCGKDSAVVFLLPKALKRPLMQYLSRFNVTGMSLFPGLDGVGLSVREAMAYAIEGPSFLSPLP